MYNVTVLEH